MPASYPWTRRPGREGGYLVTLYARRVWYRSVSLRTGCIGVVGLSRGRQVSRAMRPRSRRLYARRSHMSRSRCARRSCACSLGSWADRAFHARPSRTLVRLMGETNVGLTHRTTCINRNSCSLGAVRRVWVTVGAAAVTK
jgi:hypothetical protein